jgi:hypothetical protein
MDILDKRLILPENASRTKKGVLRDRVHALTQRKDQVLENRLMDFLLERESLGSTGGGKRRNSPAGECLWKDKVRESGDRNAPPKNGAQLLPFIRWSMAGQAQHASDMALRIGGEN